MALDVSIAEEIAQVQIGAPHVVILGAGASRAACPNGDANGRRLPLMNDLSQLPAIASLLGPDKSRHNFEEAYARLASTPGTEGLRSALEQEIHRYFSALELPAIPTIYDHLVTALRPKDVIATFNWDPFLIQAIRRNRALAPDRYPRLVFLHGNVMAGYCEQDKVVGTVGTVCEECGRKYTASRLLYPVTEKNYRSEPMIASGWDFLERALKRAFMITVFGYGAPASDVSAMSLLHSAWGSAEARQMEQVEIIDIRPEDDLVESWSGFIHSHHYEVISDFYSSSIANHPRRTGEAYWNQFVEAKFVTRNPIPRDTSLAELSSWLLPLIDAERNATDGTG